LSDAHFCLSHQRDEQNLKQYYKKPAISSGIKHFLDCIYVSKILFLAFI